MGEQANEGAAVAERPEGVSAETWAAVNAAADVLVPRLQSSIDERVADAESRLRETQSLTMGAVASRLRPPASAARPAGPFATFGHQLKAIVSATMGDADARQQLMAAASGAGEAVDADGGFLILPQFVTTIERRMHDTGQLLRLMNPVDVAGNSLTLRMVDEKSRANGSRNGAVLGYWVDEGEAPTASQLKFARLELRLKKLAAIGYLTDELLEDVPALGQMTEDAFVEELVFQVEDSIIEGSGAGQPLGVENSGAMIQVAKETGQVAATIVPQNLSNMWARLHSRSKANAVWLINTDVNPALDELALPVGTGALEPRFVNYGPDGILRIKGRPVIEVEYCETLGTAGDILLIDPTQYLLIQKAGGPQAASSMHVRFIQDEMTFRVTYRVDGAPKWRTTLTPFKGSNSVSPFVKLATRS